MHDDIKRSVLLHRVDQANEVLDALASHGPRLFYSPQYDLYSGFMVDSGMQGWWIDCRTGMKSEASFATAMYYGPQRDLIEALMGYIKSGKAIDASCVDAVAWLYSGPDMESVRDALNGNDAVQC